jgi:hypothetical protein
MWPSREEEHDDDTDKSGSWPREQAGRDRELHRLAEKGGFHEVQAVSHYEPQSDGDLKLMGGEYFCPIEACPTPPTLFNQAFRFEEDTNGHALHVWAWLRNPNGLTNPANPNVDTTYCP